MQINQEQYNICTCSTNTANYSVGGHSHVEKPKKKIDLHPSELKTLRKLNRWSQSKVAKEARISLMTYQRFEKDWAKVSIPNLVKIGEVFGMHIDIEFKCKTCKKVIDKCKCK